MSEQEFETPQEPEVTDAPEVETPEAEQPEAETHQEVQPPVKNWSDDDEQEARLFGWKAPDEWQGEKPPGYIDNPQEYLERVQRSRIFKTMQDKMTEQERKLAAVNDRALERQRQDYEARMQAITDQQRKAVEMADTEAWDKLERQRQDMMQQAPQQQEPQGPDPVLVEYKQSNEWAQDPVLWQEAVQAVNVGLQMGMIQTSDPAEQLKFAEERIYTKYPHLRPNQQKPQPQRQRVDGGGLATGPARQRSGFEKLPSDAKDAFKRFVDRGVYSDTKEDREEYAREYNAA